MPTRSLKYTQFNNNITARNFNFAGKFNRSTWNNNRHKAINPNPK